MSEHTMSETGMAGAGTSSANPIPRREFAKAGLALVGVAYGAAISYPIYRYLATPAMNAAEMASVSEVAIPVVDLPGSGTALMFRFGSKPAMLITHEDGSMVCFEAVCTHLGCTVQYQPEEQRIYCACHNGVYDMHTGANVAGPPPKPLPKFNVEKQDEQVVITRA